MPNFNLELLKQVAKRLGPLRSEVIFVGGFTTGLFITDEAAAEVRPTFDVDVIAEITSYANYATFSERLHALGFREDASPGAPFCRWLIDEMKLDVMPLEEGVDWHLDVFHQNRKQSTWAADAIEALRHALARGKLWPHPSPGKAHADPLAVAGRPAVQVFG